MSDALPAGFESRGSFWFRAGGAYNADGKRSTRKLCLVATDRDTLVSVLSDLAERDDCFAVKMSSESKDGMYLGRCFMADDDRVGTLWHELKRHPSLMCSVQDDVWIHPYRGG